jgi:Integrase core domain
MAERICRKLSRTGRFRDECLILEQLWTLTEVRIVIGDYRQKCNEVRPHSRLGYENPAVFELSIPISIRASLTPLGMVKEPTKI